MGGIWIIFGQRRDYGKNVITGRIWKYFDMRIMVVCMCVLWYACPTKQVKMQSLSLASLYSKNNVLVSI
jgi:hypothetical protein